MAEQIKLTTEQTKLMEEQTKPTAEQTKPGDSHIKVTGVLVGFFESDP